MLQQTGLSHHISSPTPTHTQPYSKMVFNPACCHDDATVPLLWPEQQHMNYQSQTDRCAISGDATEQNRQLSIPK